LPTLKNLLNESTSDSSRALLLAQTSVSYSIVNPDTGLSCARTAVSFSLKIGYTRGEAFALSAYGWNLSILGDYKPGVEYALKALRLFEELNDQQEIAYTYIILDFNFRELGDYDHALYYGYKAKDIFSSLKETRLTPIASYKKINLIVIAETFERMGRLDSALAYVEMARSLDSGKWNLPVSILANIFTRQQKYDKALFFYRSALQMAYDNNIAKDITDIENNIAKLYYKTGQFDSAAYYAKSVVNDYRKISYVKGLMEATATLSQVYLKGNNKDSALKYIVLQDAYEDNLFSREKEKVDRHRPDGPRLLCRVDTFILPDLQIKTTGQNGATAQPNLKRSA
jgi:tetratricopeptide (TPR) repeat protein